MLGFCYYLRGHDEKDKNILIKLSYKVFLFKHFPLILRLFFPALFSVCTLVFILLLADVIGTEFLVYQVGLLGGKFYKSLSKRDLNSFKDIAFLAIGLIIINALMVSLNDFFAQLLSVLWRKNITLKLHDLYFKNKNFYYLQQPDESDIHSRIESSNLRSTAILIPPESKKTLLDNPDQRITQDVYSLCKSFSTILPTILISPFVICWYTYQAFVYIGYSGPLTVFVYFIVWSIINGPLTGPIAKVIYKQDKKEGDFRFRHMNLRMNAESIAFYDSSQIELTNINSVFTSLLDILFRKNWKELILKFFVKTSQYMGGIIAYLILGIPIFTHVYDDLKPEDLAQLISNFSFKSQYLIYLFTRLFDTLDDLSSINGNTQRVVELINTMNGNKQNDSNQSRKQSNDLINDDQICFIIENLDLSVPDKSKALIKGLNIIFRQNENILITGRSGCGKTSLFRSINGLWNYHTGKIYINHKSKKIDPSFLFFLPQKSYFTSGSLFEQIIYPCLATDIPKETKESLASIIYDWLKKFNLEHLLTTVDLDMNSKPSFEWQTVLSPGEQQRLSFLRVLYHRPKFILLDEFTSSVDQETESLMYETLNELKITYLSIAHRDTVKKYHQVELKFLNDSSYIISNIL